jgi:hypothetical protein
MKGPGEGPCEPLVALKASQVVPTAIPLSIRMDTAAMLDAALVHIINHWNLTSRAFLNLLDGTAHIGILASSRHFLPILNHGLLY